MEPLSFLNTDESPFANDCELARLGARWVAPARELGGEDCVLRILADVSDLESVQKAVGRTISELRSLHVRVNNPGINTKSAPVQTAPQCTILTSVVPANDNLHDKLPSG